MAETRTEREEQAEQTALWLTSEQVAERVAAGRVKDGEGAS